jgi:hypothetical protein
LNPADNFVIGQSVYCEVWELLSILDKEGRILDIEGDWCLVVFTSGIKRIHKQALRSR